MNRRVESIKYGQKNIVFDVLYLDRKTLEIVVHPDQSVVVKVPLDSHAQEIIRRVYKRAEWIKRQMRYFEQFEPRTPQRRYLGGESHFYLGRKYRLKIKRAKMSQVVLKGGYLYIQSSSLARDNLQRLLEVWYRQKASVHFQDVFNLCWQGFQKNITLEPNRNHIKQPNLTIRKMKTRWGSLSKMGSLALNLDLIKVSKVCIEYVVIHELCHLLHCNHGPEFYSLLERTLPDWSERKQSLEMILA